MAKMKAVQVPKAGADFEIVEREIPQPGAGTGEDSRPGLWSLSQRRDHQGRSFPGHYVPARPRARSGRRDRRSRRGSQGMEERPARWRRLARRAGRHVPRLPPRGFRELREREDLRHHLRRRLSGIHGRAGGSVGADAGIARRSRGRAADVRRGHHV